MKKDNVLPFYRGAIDVDGDLVKVIERKTKKQAHEEGFEEVDEFVYGEYKSGKHTGKRGIIVKKGGKYSLFKLFIAILLGICLNILDFESIRTHARYARTKPRIENSTA